MVAPTHRARFAESNLAAGAVRDALEKPVELAREYPLSSMLIVFGMGLGVGVILSQVLCSSGVMSSFYHEPTFAEKLSHQIYDAVQKVLPESVSGQFARFQR